MEAKAEGGVRVPKLWCYGLLAFLDDKSAPERDAGAGEDAGSRREPRPAEPPDGEIEELDEHILEMDYKEHGEKCGENNATIEHTARSSEDYSDSDDDPIVAPRAKIRKTDLSVARAAAPSAESCPRGSRGEAAAGARRPEDRHDIYCKSVACKLRDLPRHQRLLAEHLINEVLFEAEWGNLTLKHRLAS